MKRTASTALPALLLQLFFLAHGSRVSAQEIERWAARDAAGIYPSASDACNAELEALRKEPSYSVTLDSITPMPEFSLALCNFTFTYPNGARTSGPYGVANLCTPELKESHECSPSRPARMITLAITGKVGTGDDRRGEVGGMPFTLVYTFNDKKGTLRIPECKEDSCESELLGSESDSPGIATLQIGDRPPYAVGRSSVVGHVSTARRTIWPSRGLGSGRSVEIKVSVNDGDGGVGIDFVDDGDPLLTTSHDLRSPIPNSKIPRRALGSFNSFTILQDDKWVSSGSLLPETICVSDQPSDCPQITVVSNRIVDIFIGGAGDQTLGHVVLDYFAKFKENHPEILSKYVSYTEASQNSDASIRSFITNLPAGTVINLIGHSYGGDTALNIATTSGRKIHLLITVDPVGGRRQNKYPNIPPSARSGATMSSWYKDLQAKWKAVRANAEMWIDIDSVPSQAPAKPVCARRPTSTSPFDPDNIAFFGFKWDTRPNSPIKFDDTFIKALGCHHEQFEEMMKYPSSSGNRSAEDLLLGH